MKRTVFGFLALASLCSLTALGADDRMPTGVADYAGWVGHKVGATATHELEETSGDKTTKIREVYTLKTVEPDKLVVVRAATRTDASGRQGSSTESTSTLTPPKEAPRPNPDSTIEQGDEEVKIGDKTYKCHFFKLTAKRETTTRVWTVWTNPEVPGGIVKQTTVMTNGDKTLSTMTDTLVEFKSGT